MYKFPILIAAIVLAAPTPAGSYDGVNHHRSRTEQGLGGHSRHGHRDWSGTGGRGHVHNVCWWNGFGMGMDL